jgi:DNA-binding GntR family transcriptional regulator
LIATKLRARQHASTASRPNTLIEDAYKKIKQMIFEQKVAPGQRLVYEDLGELLHMSRTPVINALNRLEQEGFVASESFRGFYVRPIDPQEVWDAFGVREALEVYAVEQAINFGDKEGFAQLEEKLESTPIRLIIIRERSCNWIPSFIFKSPTWRRTEFSDIS